MPQCPICLLQFSHKPRYRKTTFCSTACANSRLKSKNNESNSDVWFWSKAKKSPRGCIEWTGSTKNGYGIVSRPFGVGTFQYAHRVSFRLSLGRDAVGVVRHICDNRLCVNPDHLLEGSIQDNVSDAVVRDRVAYGERAAASKLTEDQVAFARQSPLMHTEIAALFGVCDSTILRARKGDTWRRLS